MTYIIGEIGQNHNGSVEIAKQIIDIASQPITDELFGRELQVMNAVKLTKRDLNEELTASSMNAPYNSPNAFGKTYGEHREFLELNEEQHFECYQYAKDKGLDFIETLCAIGCLDMLKLFSPDYLKVASRDLTNLPLLKALAETNIPIILSTGMADQSALDNALNVISKHHENISILHCLSEYPANYKNLNLNTIKFLKKEYSKYKIGYSDHSIGIMVPVAAVALGAEIIEKHITMDRSLKGSDQAGSLESDGIKRMVRDIRNLEMSLGEEDILISESVASSQKKLERSIATKVTLNKGDIISEENIHLLSPGDGFKWSEKEKVIGKTLLKNVLANELIYPQDIIE